MPKCFYCHNSQHFYAERAVVKGWIIRVDIHCADANGVWLESEGPIHGPGQVLVQAITYVQRKGTVQGVKFYGCGNCSYRWVYWDRPYLRLPVGSGKYIIQVPYRNPKSSSWFETPEIADTYQRRSNRSRDSPPIKSVRRPKRPSKVSKRQRLQLDGDQNPPVDDGAGIAETP